MALKIRFFSPQQIIVELPLAKTYQMMSRLGGGPGKAGENYSEVLQQDGNKYEVRFTTFAAGREIKTREEVVLYPPDVITYRHLGSPLDYVYEVFTAEKLSGGRTRVNYIGQYAWRWCNWLVLGWLVHKLLVLPRYDPVIAKHLAKVKCLSKTG